VLRVYEHSLGLAFIRQGSRTRWGRSHRSGRLCCEKGETVWRSGPVIEQADDGLSISGRTISIRLESNEGKARRNAMGSTLSGTLRNPDGQLAKASRERARLPSAQCFDPYVASRLSREPQCYGEK
jgi:hypothetical protein